MKLRNLLFAALACVLLAACAPTAEPSETTAATVPESRETTTATTAPEETEATLPPIVLELTEDETQMLLKIGMAELGHTECTECIALVVRTVLNRLEAGGYGRTLYGVLHAQDQFTPVMDGSYERAEPNDACREALDMVIRGWDESQGALFYEFYQGESWHSKNLELLTEYCNTRFYK